jgi:hypothetical protein
LAGDIAVGPYHSGAHKDAVLGQSSPRLFVYSSSDVGPATVFGTYPRHQQGDTTCPSFPYPWFSNPPFNHHTNISSAPLEDVVCAWVREDKDRRCHGMLFEYADGAQRALGDYRFGGYLPGTDRVKKYLRPLQICYLPPQHEGTGSEEFPCHFIVNVSNHHDHDHGYDAAGWICNPLRGVLEFWFSRQRSVLRIAE